MNFPSYLPSQRYSCHFFSCAHGIVCIAFPHLYARLVVNLEVSLFLQISYAYATHATTNIRLSEYDPPCQFPPKNLINLYFCHGHILPTRPRTSSSSELFIQESEFVADSELRAWIL